MASSSEIVEIRDELDLLRHFHRANRLRLKLRTTESTRKSSHASSSPNSRTRLMDAVDLKESPRLLSREIRQGSKLKKPLEIFTPRGASRGIEVSESPSLKQALRKLCVSHASEMAAMRRSVAVEARNLLVKERSNAVEAPNILRTKEIVEEKSGIKGGANSKAAVKKGKQEAVPAPASSIRLLNLNRICRMRCKIRPDSICSSGCNDAVKESLRSREKGERSQSSKSSLGDYNSSSTSMSEESSYFGSTSNCNRPHRSKDARWAAVHSVVMEQGSLGVKDFKLVRRLGYGDIGTVYLAELIGTGCSFALKVMDIELLVRRKKMIRAQTEREILQMLDHPFLPTLYAHFTSDNLAFLVMEYCPGGDLHVLRQKQPSRTFQEPAARFYVAEVLLALEYLHMLGVIYRDLKPENILIREDSHIMLSDFDLSMRCNVSPTILHSSVGEKEQPKKLSRPQTRSSCILPFCPQPSCDQVSCFTPRLLKNCKIKSDPAQFSTLPQLVVEPTDARSNSFVGTHEYLAPEIIIGDGHGSSVDWWTLGIFLYELLFGRTPFKGSGNEETLSNVVSQGLIFPESPVVGHHVKDLIRGLLTKEPGSRLGSVKGAAEIKQHPFFEGLNWALIRCAAPPEVLRNWNDEIPHTSKMEEVKCLGSRISTDNLEVKLF